MSLRAVLLDFDFTLVDSSRGFIECHEYACRRLGLPPVSARDSMAMMGTPLAEAFRLLFAAEHHHLCDEYLHLFHARADEVMADLTEVFPEAVDSLAGLKRQGLALGIVSQKLRRRIEAVLERDNLTKWFDVVIGGEDITRFKPDPEGLLKASYALAVASGETLYAGDTVIDAKAAANAGSPFVAVLSGVTAREAFDGLPNAGIIDNVAALPELCRRLS